MADRVVQSLLLLACILLAAQKSTSAAEHTAEGDTVRVHDLGIHGSA
jgi:hypothetical protein